MIVPLFVIATFVVCRSEIQILDYSKSQVISIHLGEARIQKGTFKLIHVLELDNYDRAINDLYFEIKQDALKNSSVLPFLLHDINHLKSELRRMKPRVKRSIDILGTAWKWIAGTPDHEDHKIVVDQVNGLLVNNEKQRIINKDTIDKINTLTATTNEILRSLHSIEEIKRTIEATISSKMNILKEEITNIDYAMQWAKVDVINSFILSEKEIFQAKQFLDSENFPYNSLEEALGFANIKIATNESTILYIISLPAIDEKICDEILLKPVKDNETILKIESEKIIKCKNEIYQIKENCNQFNNLIICSEENLNNISNSDCIPLLLNSKKHNCPVINNQHVPSVQEITEGMVLLNQFNGPLTMFGNTSYQLEGTFLIKFHNITITVGRRNFVSKEMSFYNPLPAVLQLAANKTQIEEVLSLEMIKQLQTSNIDKLSFTSTTGKVVFTSNLVLLVILAVGLLLIFIKRRTQRNSEVNLTTVVREEPAPRIVNLEMTSSNNPQQELRSANDLPAY